MELDIRANSPYEIDQTLVFEGVLEPGATATFRDILTGLKDDQGSKLNVFDIGANNGYYALLEAEILGEQGNIYAIEAEPNNVDRLEKNLTLNGYSNVEVLQIAIGAERTELELAKRERSSCHRMKEITSGEMTVSTVEVEVQPIDHLVAEREIPSDEILLIRMDIEGYESQALDGMSELLGSDRPMYIFMEIHPNVDGVDPGNIVDILSRYRFSPEYVSFDGGEEYETLVALDSIREIESNTHLMVSRK
jgi:FkbM family methyltransferase